MPMDVSQKSSIDDCIQELASQHKVTVDILVSNAGVSLRGTVLDTDIEVHRKMMEINYFGPVNLVKGTDICFKFSTILVYYFYNQKNFSKTIFSQPDER